MQLLLGQAPRHKVLAWGTVAFFFFGALLITLKLMAFAAVDCGTIPKHNGFSFFDLYLWHAILMGATLFLGFALNHRQRFVREGRRKHYLVTLNLLLLVTCFSVLTCAVFAYRRDIYPKISPAFGGGDFSEIELITTKDDAKVLVALVPLKPTCSNRYVSESVKLVEETPLSYIVLTRENPSSSYKHAVVINKELIKGLRVSRQKGKEIAKR